MNKQQGPVIDVVGMSKTFRLYNHPVDRLKEWASYSSRARHIQKRVLKDLSFHVHRGECLGIVGANGSGKTTLLRVLSGILMPDTGSVTVSARPFPMFETSTGLNPQLTGDKNMDSIVSLLGISRRVFLSQRNAIIEFSELGDALSRPIREYSSGMKSRLTFSLYSHLEPRLMLIDEVMSVGDKAFREKSIKKMKSLLQDKGVTAVLASHNLQFLGELCSRVIWIDKGEIRMSGRPESVIGAYSKGRSV